MPRILSFNQKMELIQALEKCDAVRDDVLRGAILSTLPADWTATLGNAPNLRGHVTNIVTKLAQYSEGIDTLLTSVKFQEGANTEHMTEVERVWTRILESTTMPPTSSIAQPPLDPDTQLASEYHWDRDEVTKVFVGMIKEDSSYAPWRLLAIRGPKKAGLSTFVERLEFICREVGKRDVLTHPLLYARIRLESSMIRPDTLVSQILTTLARNADECIAEVNNCQPPSISQMQMMYLSLREQFDSAVSAIDEKRAAIKEPSGAGVSGFELAKDLTKCFEHSKGQCMKVLLLHNFEQIESLESGKWLLDTWLIRHLVNLEGVVIFIAGASELDKLENRDKYTYCKTLPDMEEYKWLEWVHQGWGLTEISDSQVKEAMNDCNSNPAEFLSYLNAWRITHRKPRPSSVEQIKRGHPG